jgi:ribonuclease HI
MACLGAWKEIGAEHLVLKGVRAEWATTDAWRQLENRRRPPPFHPTSMEMQEAYEAELQKELREELIETVTQIDVRWLNPTFVIRKASGEWRKILSCVALNKCLRSKTIKMESIESTLMLAKRGDWATKIDLKSAYSHVPVQLEFRPYLGFQYQSRLYRYRTMPFGLRTAPRVFTKMLRPVAAWLRQHMQTRLTVYMDDILVLAATEDEATRQTDQVRVLLERLGWTLSYEKCKLVPAHSVEFLGWTLDFNSESIRTTKKRRQALQTTLLSFLARARHRRMVPCRELASLLGELNFLRTQFPTASLYMSALNAAKTKGVRTRGWNGSTRLTPLLTGDIKWWLKTIKHNNPHKWTTPRPTCTVTTDASPWGWGATCTQQDTETQFAWGTWSTEQSNSSSNRKELTATIHALKAFLPSIPPGSTIELRSDNTAAVHSIRRWRGTQARIPILRRIANLARNRNIRLVATYLPGTANETADALSRMGGCGEYFVTMTSLRVAIAGLGQQALTLDAFASRETKRLTKYCTLDRNDAEAYAVDGLTVDWSQEVVLLHPPPTLILRTLRKLMRERPAGWLLLLPSWRGQSWTPMLKDLNATTRDLGSYQTAAKRTRMMTERGWLLPPGNLLALTMDTKMTGGRSSLTSSPKPEDCHSRPQH